MKVTDLWTVQIIDTGGPYEHAAHSRTFHDTPALMAEAEENLTDLLPAGYQARIRRWDHPDEGDNPDE